METALNVGFKQQGEGLLHFSTQGFVCGAFFLWIIGRAAIMSLQIRLLAESDRISMLAIQKGAILPTPLCPTIYSTGAGLWPTLIFLTF